MVSLKEAINVPGLPGGNFEILFKSNLISVRCEKAHPASIFTENRLNYHKHSPRELLKLLEQILFKTPANKYF